MQTAKRKEYRGEARQAAPTSDRIPPQALDVERTILGSMLIDSAAVDAALELLGDENFYSEAHARIFICMRELADKNISVDIITVSDKLRSKGWMEAVGSETYLSELAENVVTAGNIQHYASIVKEKSTLRQLISAAADITTECFTSELEAQDVLDAAEIKIFGISESRIKNKVQSVGQLLPRVLEEIYNYAKGGVQGVPTGFKDLDQMTTGLNKGDLVIVGGRPSMGKTAFCLSIALHTALQARHTTAIFSLEMSRDQILQRLLCAEARVNMHSMRGGYLSKHDKDKLIQVTQPFSEAPLFIDDTPAITVLELRAKARRLKKQHNLGLIIVDYLQLMTPSIKSDSVQQDVSQISRSLKAIARELEVPVIALSQLSREVEKRPDKRPMLSDLRESGAIEQDADLVMFVYRDEVYNRDDLSNKNLAEIIIGKQRNGPIGKVDVRFDREYARFQDLEARPDYQGPRGME